MIEPTRLLVLRHGQTAWNADQRIQGQLDIALNDVGRWQATQLAQALAHEQLTTIVSSDLQRALATAQALAATTGAPIVTDTGLRERSFGSFQGRTFVQIEAAHPQEAQRWRQRDVTYSPGGDGESLTVFYDRIVAAVSRIAAAHAGEQIAIVAHGGVLDCLYRAANGVALDAPRSWPVPNASINRLLFTGEGFSLVCWNDDAHLAGQAGPSFDTAAADVPR